LIDYREKRGDVKEEHGRKKNRKEQAEVSPMTAKGRQARKKD